MTWYILLFLALVFGSVLIVVVIGAINDYRDIAKYLKEKNK